MRKIATHETGPPCPPEDYPDPPGPTRTRQEELESLLFLFYSSFVVEESKHRDDLWLFGMDHLTQA